MIGRRATSRALQGSSRMLWGLLALLLVGVLPSGVARADSRAGSGNASTHASPLAAASPTTAGLTKGPLAEPARAEPARPAGPPPAAPDVEQQLVSLWQASRGSVRDRAARFRPLALRRGVHNLDAVARALLIDPELGDGRDRAQAAVWLAPDLPAAHAALAAARLSEDHDPMGAARALEAAVVAIPRNLEASLWLGATAVTRAARGMCLAALVFFLFAALGCLSHAAHDLGDLLGGPLPSFARAALVSALVLLPAALGEGALGAGVALFGVAFCYASAGRRVVLGAAALLLVVGLYPGSDLAARLLTALDADPVAEAAYAAEQGLASPLHVLRLERARASDRLAVEALAMRAQHADRMREADALFGELLAGGPVGARVLNNAGNVRLALGDAEGAIDLYEKALAERPTAVTWFNLAQAYGRAIRVEDHDRALAEAQALDANLMRQLTEVLAVTPGGYTADLALPAAVALRRMLRWPSPVAAAGLRRPLAPGLLGSGPPAALAAFAAAALLAATLRRRFRPSGYCIHCGERTCPRCPPRPAAEGLCPGCARLLHRPETTDPTLRAARLEALRGRSRRRQRWARIFAWAVPGAGGVLFHRPLSALASLLLFAGAVSGLTGASLGVPDPLASGTAGALALISLGVGFGLLYLALTALVALRGGS